MTDKSASKSLSQWLLVGLIIFVAAAAGMYFGGMLRQQQAEDAMAVEADVFTNLSLTVGVPFPDIEIETSTYGRISSRKILHPEGTVVLFMEAECSPCHGLSKTWQQAIADGVIAREQVVGISYSDVNRLAESLANYHIEFPLYADPNYAFMDQYGVDAFPLILVIGKSGIVRYSDIDARKQISPDELKEMLES